MLKYILSSCIIASSTLAIAQESGYNPYSVRPVHESDVMYKKTIVRALDLREKQNLPMFSTNREVTKIIIDAVKKGELKPYTSDSLDQGRSYTKEEFQKKITMAMAQDEDAEPAPEGETAPADAAAAGGMEYLPKQLYQMQMKEDYIFDKQRSRAYYDIQCITMLIPSEFNPKGIEEPIGTFKFKDLVEIFKKDPRAIWFNPNNDSEHRTLVDTLFLTFRININQILISRV